MEPTGERWIPGKSDARVEAEHTARYQFAQQYVSGKVVLDIACGAGAGSYWLIRHGGAKSVLGVDIDPESVRHAQTNYEWPGLRYEVGSLETAISQGGFDVVVCYETIEHVENDSLALRNIRCALKERGRLVLSTPNRRITSPRADTINDKPDNPFHRREYVLPELLAALRAAGFAVSAINGQRFRTHFSRGTLNRVADIARRLVGYRPDFQSSPQTRSYRIGFRQPRIWVLVCEKTST